MMYMYNYVYIVIFQIIYTYIYICIHIYVRILISWVLSKLILHFLLKNPGVDVDLRAGGLEEQAGGFQEKPCPHINNDRLPSGNLT